MYKTEGTTHFPEDTKDPAQRADVLTLCFLRTAGAQHSGTQWDSSAQWQGILWRQERHPESLSPLGKTRLAAVNHCPVTRNPREQALRTMRLTISFNKETPASLCKPPALSQFHSFRSECCLRPHGLCPLGNLLRTLLDNFLR